MLLQGGVDDLALFAIGHGLAGNRVDDLYQNLVFYDVQAVLVLAHGRAGAVDVGQAEEVVYRNIPDVLDGLTGGFDGTAGLAGDDDGLQACEVHLGVVALLDRLLAQQPCVAGGRPEEGGLVLLHGPQQAVGGNGTHPDAQGTQVLRTDDAGAAYVQGEVHAVQVTVVGTHACLPEQAGFRIHEVIEVLLVEGAHGGNAGGTGAGRHVDHVIFGHAAQLAEEGAHALGLALGRLLDEGELAQVVQGLDFGGDPRLVPCALVVGAVVVGELQLVLQQLQLELFQLFARHGLDFRIIVFLIVGNLLLCHFENSFYQE